MFLVNWYNIFYWLSLSDGIKSFFNVSSNIFTTISVISFIAIVIITWSKSVQISNNNVKNPEGEQNDPDIRAWETARKYTMKLFSFSLIISLITWFGYVAIPSKKDCIFIIAGGSAATFITSDSSVKALPSDLTRYLHLSLKDKINELSDESKKEIGISTPKDSIKNSLLKKVEDLTKDEIIEQIKKGTLIGKNDQ